MRWREVAFRAVPILFVAAILVMFVLATR